MKKILALCLAVLMLMLTVAGCGSSDSKEATEPKQTLNDDHQAAIGGGYTFPTLDWDETEPSEPEEELPPVELEQLGYVSLSNKIQHEDLEYVMVYNPYVYSEFYAQNITLSTGNMADQIVVDMNRGDGLTDIPDQIPMGQDQLTNLVATGEVDDVRADAMGRSFRQGDVEQFYTYSSTSMEMPRQLREFTCVYAGEYCNIWSYENSISKEDAQLCAEEFDTNIYTQMVEKFGEPRFDSEVNFLYYPMQDNIMGCFCGLDLLTEDELPVFQVENAGCNTNVNLLHMSSKFEATDFNAISTLAHEFQHLICFADSLGVNFYTPCATWINEAMSGYVEEMIYPGVQYEAGRMDQLMESNMIRYGQSLYNFSIMNTYEEFDIGVYGSVYLYSMYLERLAGEDVFANFHDYWRNVYSETLMQTFSEAEALANAVPEEIYQAVDESVRYPTAVVFDGFISEEEQWMSKLTLQFYLDLLDVDESDPADFRNVDPKTLVYDQLEPAMIEGGGRVILQVKDGVYEVPTLSGQGLIYVALDEEFNVLGISYS